EADTLGLKYYAISAVTGEGTKPLLYDLYDAVKIAQADENAALDEEGSVSEARNVWVEKE
ncbi:GTPase ObgE, partial [bacterium AH-315-G11]|nr:GTPase ObgE [bacterium AH-315-G11]